MSEARRQVGIVGLYDEPDRLIQAAEKVRDAGYCKWDCHTPYPVHGLDQAMGIRESALPFFALSAGFVGIGVALLMQWWMSAVDYPVRIGGKPLFSWPAFVPITFELFVLFAALTTMACIVVQGRLGRWHSPLHDSNVMEEITSRRFAVVLEANDEKYSEEEARKLLESTSPAEIRPLYENEEETKAP